MLITPGRGRNEIIGNLPRRRGMKEVAVNRNGALIYAKLVIFFSRFQNYQNSSTEN